MYSTCFLAFIFCALSAHRGEMPLLPLTKGNLMSLTINAKTYTGNGSSPQAQAYIGPAKTASVLDDIRLSVVPAKPTTVFSGVIRANAKLSRTLTLTGSLTPSGVGIVEINVTVPVGAASADIDALLNDMGAGLASATWKTFVKTLQFSF